MSNNHYISFIVDAQPKFYYQAELLLFSIENYVKFPKEKIIVQCIKNVDYSFINFLKNKGYTYIFNEPFLDKKYCNKLTQLDYFENKLDKSNIDGVLLIDTDLFFIRPLNLCNLIKFTSKIVDASNPPIESLNAIFKHKNISIPKTVNTDSRELNSMTISTNFNGGFYYIPSINISVINSEWKKNADWLYQNRAIFLEERYHAHIDQISMSLAIASNNIPYDHLATNYNYPLHLSPPFTYYKKAEPIAIIHYHDKLSHLGLLYQPNENNYLKKIISKINVNIATQLHPQFLIDYKKSVRVNIKITNKTISFENRLSEHLKQFNKRLRLIIHCGTPKTGTSSLQFFLYKNREEIKKYGYYYAPVIPNSDYEPKHQWFLNSIKSNNYDIILHNIKQIIEEIDLNIHSIIITTEGIYNHWWDLSPESKQIFRILSRFFEVQTITYFRHPDSFGAKLYIQYLKNPQLEGNCCYGYNLSFNSMFNQNWFADHLDYYGYIQEHYQIFGKDNVILMNYDNLDTVHSFCNYFNIPINHNITFHENLSPGLLVVYLIRLLNIFKLNPRIKRIIISQMVKIEKRLFLFIKFKLSKSNSDLIKSIMSSQRDELKKHKLYFD